MSLTAAVRNLLRIGAVLKSRAYKAVFTENEAITRDGEHVLADLRRFCHADLNRPSLFDPNAMIMARREGRREVFLRIINFLNLDEAAVQKMMELDDGR